MDTDLARTFLEVSRTRHFGRAARNLSLTQSAVSARIRQLEDYLGCRLFTRDHHDIRLTSAGRRLLPHAAAMVTSWNRARQDVALADHAGAALSVGVLPSIWDAWLMARLRVTLAHFRETGLSLDIHGGETLLPRLLDGVLDLVFLYEPPHMASLVVRDVGHIALVLVSSEPGRTPAKAIDDAFVHIDWGTSFANAFSRAFPGSGPPLMRTNLGGVARDMLLHAGGSAYLPRSAVENDIASDRLFTIDAAPIIDRTIFAVYADGHDARARMESLLDSLAV